MGCMITAPKGTIRKLAGDESDSGDETDSDDPEYIIAYTSVSHRPSEITYQPSCESLSLAIPTPSSRSHTNTSTPYHNWTKVQANPILPGAPVEDVIAWRDPSVREWESLDKLRGKDGDGDGEGSERGLYGIIAGGLKDIGSAIFLYEIPSHDLTSWTYLGDLGSRQKIWPQGNQSDEPDSDSESKNNRWVANTRDIFEVANFFTLSATTSSGKTIEREVLLMSAATIESDKPELAIPPRRPARQQIFITGELSLSNSNSNSSEEQVLFNPVRSGYIDRGNYYAQNTFPHPDNANALIAWGWITEDDSSGVKRKEQGWSGCMSSPRVLEGRVVEGVVGCLEGALEGVGSVEVLDGGEGQGKEIFVLRVEPYAPVLDKLKSRAKNHTDLLKGGEGGKSDSDSREKIKLPHTSSRTLIIEATVAYSSISPAADLPDFHLAIRHNADKSIGTFITFSPSTSTLTLDRSKSVPTSELQYHDTRADSTPHTLFKTLSPSDSTNTNTPTLEPLDLTIIIDHGVIEIFANGRTCLTSRIYTGNEPGSDGAEVGLVGEKGGEGGGEGRGRWERLEVWEGFEAEMNYI